MDGKVDAYILDRNFINVSQPYSLEKNPILIWVHKIKLKIAYKREGANGVRS